MNFVVCLKRVPDSAAKIKVAADGKSIETSGVDHVISPYDEIALERALQLREEHGGEVTVLCLGLPEASKEIRQALAMGADKAIHLKDGGGSRGPFEIAKALAEVLGSIEADLVLFGKQSIDADNGAVGIMTAQLLGRPVISLVTKLEIADGKVLAHRESDAGTEVVEASLPAVVTAQRGLAEPRYPSIKGIMQAKKKPIDERDAPASEGSMALDSIVPPPERQGGRIVGEGVDAVAELVRLLRQEAKVL